MSISSPIDPMEHALSETHFAEFLRLLEIVEHRTRRVRAVFKTSSGQRVAEFTIRNQSVEPGVIIRGSVFRDERLRHDADWLAQVLRNIANKRLTSAQLSRKLVRSTRKVEEAEAELRALTARALLELASIGVDSKLEVEFDKSGPKRGPVFSFPSIELLAAVCDDFASGPASHEGADAMTTFASAVWNFRPSHRIAGHDFVPVAGTQGESNVAETLALASTVAGLIRLAESFEHYSEPDHPICFHHLATDSSMAWIASGSEVAIGRFEGPRVIAALGPSRLLVPSDSWT